MSPNGSKTLNLLTLNCPQNSMYTEPIVVNLIAANAQTASFFRIENLCLMAKVSRDIL